MTIANCLGLLTTLACAPPAREIGHPTPSELFGSGSQVSAQSELHRKMSAAANSTKPMLWKLKFQLSPTRIFDGQNRLRFSSPILLDSDQDCQLAGATNQIGHPQSTLVLTFSVTRAGKPISVVYDLGTGTQGPLEFETGLNPNWRKKSITLPGTLIHSWTPANTGVGLVALRLASYGTFRFKKVSVYQAE